jgi:hypothetical protein
MNRQPSLRPYKKKLFELFKTTDLNRALDEINHLSPLQIINLLFSLILSTDARVKWKAVLSMGVVTRRISEQNRESSRNILRRLMWNLNDESGGIGWGSAEAMGEILAGSEFLADEFLPILIAYLREDGNYQENEIMQRGVLWGVGRTARVYPNKIIHYKQYLLPYLHSKDHGVRGLSAWITGLLEMTEAKPTLRKLLDDESKFETYMGDGVVTRTVRQFAEEALERIELAHPLSLKAEVAREEPRR